MTGVPCRKHGWTAEELRKMRELRDAGHTWKEIGVRFGVAAKSAEGAVKRAEGYK